LAIGQGASAAAKARPDIPLIASCMDWAKHRRRKAAAKCHLRLDLQSFLPRFAIVDTAKHNDAKRAREVCAGIKAGEIVIFDKAYVVFDHLADLTLRLVSWVTRAKDNLSYKVAQRLQRRPKGKILRDELIVLKSAASRQAYPDRLRRIVALVEVDGRQVEMVFRSNNLEWSAEIRSTLRNSRKRRDFALNSVAYGMPVKNIRAVGAGADPAPSPSNNENGQNRSFHALLSSTMLA
jgi:hypothetical protein